MIMLIVKGNGDDDGDSGGIIVMLIMAKLIMLIMVTVKMISLECDTKEWCRACVPSEFSGVFNIIHQQCRFHPCCYQSQFPITQRKLSVSIIIHQILEYEYVNENLDLNSNMARSQFNFLLY